MYWKKANYVIVASLEPRPKQRYSENLAFVPTEPFLTRLVQSYTQQLVTTVRSVYRIGRTDSLPTNRPVAHKLKYFNDMQINVTSLP